MAESGRQPPAAGPRLLNVEVTYALPEQQVLVALEVEEGTTVGEAIERSGIPARFPEARVAGGNVGIFGRPVALDAAVREGDRVEIYRPLIADPKQARRERAKKPGKTAGS
jgi:putative ubiquitin-RnfH superfamily antitoxin RatB of RatAB toxin-antitoxin module